MSDPVKLAGGNEGAAMLLERQYGSPVYTRTIGIVSAQVYSGDGGYQVFIVGDELASFIGSTPSLNDCKKEIDYLAALVESEDFLI